MNVVMRNVWLLAVLGSVALPALVEDQHTVTATLHVERAADPHLKAQSQVVMWLEPLQQHIPRWPTAVRNESRPLVQRHKTFVPHLLVVPVGAVVDFPNKDPFFHNVFSLFDGKRFDLGLYEAGTTQHVHFDRAGICYIFCNIHSEMSAVVIVLDTPYYGISDPAGAISIRNVPSGRYRLHVWDERSLPATLNKLTRDVIVSDEQSSLGIIDVKETEAVLAHKNKYGQDYEKPSPTSPVYLQP